MASSDQRAAIQQIGEDVNDAEVTWDDVAEAFRQRSSTGIGVKEAVEALQTTKLRPAFVLNEITTRFPL